ncbi:MAG: DUF4377 domain-containing protein [Tannerellaceae bacterium]|nr:DUF4377 domain-containing protein [Tannerellaceae bacterium]
MYKLIINMFACILLLGSCITTQETETWIVASEMADCTGVMPQKCLLVKTPGETEWEYIYQGIEGFDYVPGYEYVLEVRTEEVENPPADGSTVKYVLVKEKSRQQRTSANLPGR